MGIRRACSYQATIKTPKAPSNYSKLLLTIAQNGQNLITKTESDLQTNDTSVIVKLTQAETKLFVDGTPAFLQLRCYAGAYDAPGSKVWPVEIWPALDDEVLS